MHQVYYQFHLLGEVFQGLPLCFQLDELLLTLGAWMSPWIHHCQPRGYLCLSQFPGSQSYSFLAYSFVSVEHILQSLLRKDMWDEFLETLHICKCLILGWLISLGIEFQVVNYFPPENLRVLFYCLLASRIAVKRRKLFSFLSFQTGSWENLLLVLRVVTFLDNVPWHESIFIYCAGPSVSPGNLERFVHVYDIF